MVAEPFPAAQVAPQIDIPVRASLQMIEHVNAVAMQLSRGYARANQTGAISAPMPPASVRPSARQIADLFLLERRNRAAQFPECDFSSAVWEIMLHLYVAYEQQRDVGAYALAGAVQGPRSTVLRWIATMERQGQLVRDPDPNDRRRSFVRLVPDLRGRIEAYLERLSDNLIGMRQEE